MILTATVRDDDGEAVGTLVLQEKTFSTGSRGLFGQGKLTIRGRRYQAQMQLVAIKTKEGAERTPTA